MNKSKIIIITKYLFVSINCAIWQQWIETRQGKQEDYADIIEALGALVAELESGSPVDILRKLFVFNHTPLRINAGSKST